MMRLITTLAILMMAGTASAQTLPLPMPDRPERINPDVAPTPKEAEPNLQLKTIKGGYKIILTQKGAENLLNAMNLIRDEKRLGDLIDAITANSPPAEGRAQAALLGPTLQKQLPLLKKKLAETNGPNGVVITVLGQAEPLPIPPVARAAIDAFVPPDVKNTLQAGEAMLTTKPGFWMIEKR